MPARPARLELDVEDAAHVSLRFASGRWRAVRSTTCSARASTSFAIVGHAGRSSLVRRRRHGRASCDEGRPRPSRRAPPRRLHAQRPCSWTRCATSSRACDGGEALVCTLADGMRALRIALAARAALGDAEAAELTLDLVVTAGLRSIPARGGSKSIPRKNLRPLAGHPLVAWSIAAAPEATRVDARARVHRRRGDRAVARHYGAETPFLRPADLAKDDTPDLPVFEHALDWLERDGAALPELVVQLRPDLAAAAARAGGRGRRPIARVSRGRLAARRHRAQPEPLQDVAPARVHDGAAARDRRAGAVQRAAPAAAPSPSGRPGRSTWCGAPRCSSVAR